MVFITLVTNCVFKAVAQNADRLQDVILKSMKFATII